MNERLMDPRFRFLDGLREAHERSGLSYREVAQICDIDHRGMHYIPNRSARAGRGAPLESYLYSSAAGRGSIDR